MVTESTFNGPGASVWKQCTIYKKQPPIHLPRDCPFPSHEYNPVSLVNNTKTLSKYVLKKPQRNNHYIRILFPSMSVRGRCDRNCFAWMAGITFKICCTLLFRFCVSILQKYQLLPITVAFQNRGFKVHNKIQFEFVDLINQEKNREGREREWCKL